jgi:hypothetical protein
LSQGPEDAYKRNLPAAANTARFVSSAQFARVAKLGDAPDLGLRNHRFQGVAFHFKANAFYEWKTGISYKIVAVANAE